MASGAPPNPRSAAPGLCRRVQGFRVQGAERLEVREGENTDCTIALKLRPTVHLADCQHKEPLNIGTGILIDENPSTLGDIAFDS